MSSGSRCCESCDECRRLAAEGSPIPCPLLHDVTERVKSALEHTDMLEARWSEMVGDLEHAMHDMREPLRTITNFSELVSRCVEEDDLEAVDPHVRRIAAASKQLRNMLVSVAEIISFGAGTSDGVNRSAFRLTEVANEARAIVLANSTTPCEVEVAEDLPIIVGDRHRWVRVFQNLFCNAVKYNVSEVRRVTVSVEGPSVLVSDNGIGIPESKWNAVFELFLRLSDRSHMASGMGMGLYMARRFVEWDGGGLTIHSSDEAGTTFRIELPQG